MHCALRDRTGIRLILAAYVLASAFAGLGSYRLIDPDEPRYAQTAREMTERGDYLVPYLNGAPRLNKPPLFYWTEIASYRLFGRASEFAARLPSAMAAAVMAFFVFLLARDLYGRGAGAFAVPILVSMPLFSGVTHLATTDAMLSAFVTAALYFWWRMRASGMKARWGAASWGALSLAVLAKGPVALFLYVLVTAVFCMATADWRLLRRTYSLPGIAIVLAVNLPWPIAILSSRPDTAALWWRETVERFFTGVDHGGNVLLPLGVVIGGTFPWWLMLAVWKLSAVREFIAKRNERAPDLFLLTWAAVMTVFFSLSRTQLATYLLPVVPSVAVAASGAAMRLWSGAGDRRALFATSIVTALLAVISAAYAGFAGFARVREAALFATASVGVFSIVCALIFKGRLRAALVVLTCAVAVCASGGTLWVLKTVSARKPFAELGIAWRADLAKADHAYFVGNLEGSQGLVFYGGRSLSDLWSPEEIAVTLAKPEKVAVVLWPRNLRRAREVAVYCNLAPELWLKESGDWVLAANYPIDSPSRVVPAGSGDI